MSILTKKERAGWRNYITAAHRTPSVRVEDMHRALDTIDALEAHVDAFKEQIEQQNEILNEWKRLAYRRRRALAEIDAVARDRMYRAGHVSHETVTDRILAIIKEVEE